MHPYKRAKSFEQEILWSVLDLTDIANTIRDVQLSWNVSQDQIIDTIKLFVRENHISTYKGVSLLEKININEIANDQLIESYDIFLEPTSSTIQKINQIGENES